MCESSTLWPINRIGFFWYYSSDLVDGKLRIVDERFQIVKDSHKHNHEQVVCRLSTFWQYASHDLSRKFKLNLDLSWLGDWMDGFNNFGTLRETWSENISRLGGWGLFALGVCKLCVGGWRSHQDNITGSRRSWRVIHILALEISVASDCWEEKCISKRSNSGDQSQNIASDWKQN